METIETKPTRPATHDEFMAASQRRHGGFYLAVERNRRLSRPLFHVRSPIGTTLDMCVTEQEAKVVVAKEKGAQVFAIIGGSAVRVSL
jgi:hypothetical protein